MGSKTKIIEFIIELHNYRRFLPEIIQGNNLVVQLTLAEGHGGG